MMKNPIYFEVNNWFAGKDYPEEEPFLTWFNGYGCQLFNEDWVEEQGIAVVASMVNMSNNFCITAPEEWVRKVCPCILDNPEYREKFVNKLDEDGEPIPRLGHYFLEPEDYNVGRVEWEEDDGGIDLPWDDEEEDYTDRRMIVFGGNDEDE